MGHAPLGRFGASETVSMGGQAGDSAHAYRVLSHRTPPYAYFRAQAQAHPGGGPLSHRLLVAGRAREITSLHTMSAFLRNNGPRTARHGALIIPVPRPRYPPALDSLTTLSLYATLHPPPSWSKRGGSSFYSSLSRGPSPRSPSNRLLSPCVRRGLPGGLEFRACFSTDAARCFKQWSPGGSPLLENLLSRLRA